MKKMQKGGIKKMQMGGTKPGKKYQMGGTTKPSKKYQTGGSFAEPREEGEMDARRQRILKSNPIARKMMAELSSGNYPQPSEEMRRAVREKARTTSTFEPREEGIKARRLGPKAYQMGGTTGASKTIKSIGKGIKKIGTSVGKGIKSIGGYKKGGSVSAKKKK
jgi:hypothetical protein